MGDPKAWAPSPEKWGDAEAERARSLIDAGGKGVSSDKLELLQQALDWYDRRKAAGGAATTEPAAPAQAPAQTHRGPPSDRLLKEIEQLRAANLKPVEQERDPYTPLQSAGFGALEGGSLGMAGGAFGLGASLAGDDVQRDPRSPEPSISEMGDEYRQQRDLAYTDNPKSAIGADILAGGIVTAPLGALKPLQAAARVAPVATGSALGGLVGAFEGATRAHSGQAAEGAMEGGTTGLVTGGAVPMLGRSLGGLIGAAEGLLGSPAGARMEGAARGFKKGVDLSGVLGRAADTKRGQSSNLSGADAERMVNEGSQVLERPTASPSGDTVFPEGTRVPKDPNAVGKFGARMEKHKLTGSVKSLVTKAELAKMEAVREMDDVTRQLADMGKPGETFPRTDAEMNYLRDGMRDESRAYFSDRFSGGEPNRVASELDPIDLSSVADEQGGRQWVLDDGRHRLEAAREAGASHIPARVRTYNGSYDEAPVSESVGSMPIPAKGSKPLEVDLSGLANHLSSQEKKLRSLGLPEFAREADDVFGDYKAISEDPYRNFQTALELRRALDKKAYDAAGQKAGVVAEGYRAMATEVRKAIDKTLSEAPPELAAKLRNAFEKYETAADVSQYAAGGVGAQDTARLGVQDMNILRRVPVVGAAVKASERYGSRIGSNVYRAGQQLLLGSPGPLSGAMTSVPTPEEIEEIRRAQLQLPQ